MQYHVRRPLGMPVQPPVTQRGPIGTLDRLECFLAVQAERLAVKCTPASPRGEGEAQQRLIALHTLLPAAGV
jgi:hypothetical protein